MVVGCKWKDISLWTQDETLTLFFCIIGYTNWSTLELRRETVNMRIIKVPSLFLFDDAISQSLDLNNPSEKGGCAY